MGSPTAYEIVIIKSSGSAYFDKMVENLVYSISPLEPFTEDMKKEASYFEIDRRFNFIRHFKLPK
jgi:outer membrane biosynthesis protein TonB